MASDQILILLVHDKESRHGRRGLVSCRSTCCGGQNIPVKGKALPQHWHGQSCDTFEKHTIVVFQLRCQAALPIGTITRLGTLFIAEVCERLIELVDVLLDPLMFLSAASRLGCQSRVVTILVSLERIWPDCINDA